MANVSPSERERIDGLAVFATAAFGLSIVVLAALERVGAPDAFVEALGPLLACLALCLIGLVSRAPSLTDFLAARRAGPALYGGLAFAASVAGVAIGLSSPTDVAPPWLGCGIGVLLAALVIGPALRAANVSSVADLLATRYPLWPARIAFSLALLAVSLLTALAGFELSVDLLVASIGANRRAAEILVLLALLLSTAPGGLKGVFWTDVASGGAILLIALVGGALAVANQDAPWAVLRADVTAQRAAIGPWGVEAALAASLAGFFALTPPALAAGSSRQARAAGFLGLLFAALGLVCALLTLPYLAALPDGPPRSASALVATAFWLPALVLARAGVLGVSRAVGLDLASAYSRLTVLASRRIALSRLAMLATLGVCAAASAAHVMPTGRALELALAINLAFVVPSLALGLSRRAPPLAGLVALGVAVVVAAAQVWRAPFDPSGLMAYAATSGAAAFVSGALCALVTPANRRAQSRAADPFVDVPLDPIA